MSSCVLSPAVLAHARGCDVQEKSGDERSEAGSQQVDEDYDVDEEYDNDYAENYFDNGENDDNDDLGGGGGADEGGVGAFPTSSLRSLQSLTLMSQDMTLTESPYGVPTVCLLSRIYSQCSLVFSLPPPATQRRAFITAPDGASSNKGRAEARSQPRTASRYATSALARNVGVIVSAPQRSGLPRSLSSRAITSRIRCVLALSFAYGRRQPDDLSCLRFSQRVRPTSRPAQVAYSRQLAAFSVGSLARSDDASPELRRRNYHNGLSRMAVLCLWVTAPRVGRILVWALLFLLKSTCAGILLSDSQCPGGSPLSHTLYPSCKRRQPTGTVDSPTPTWRSCIPASRSRPEFLVEVLCADAYMQVGARRTPFTL